MTFARLASARFRSGLAAAPVSAPFAVATYVLLAAGLAAVGTLLFSSPTAAVFVAAILCGWSEVDSLCGMSHVCTLSPLRGTSRHEGLWLRATSAYTAGGLVSAVCVGAVLGSIGNIANIGDSLAELSALLLIAMLSLVLAAREFRLLQFRLPQVHRQTQKMWAFEYGVVTGAAMWGSHIGLGFATVIQHGGFFVVVLTALLMGPKLGAALLGAYWIGRTLPVWFARALAPADCDAPRIMPLLTADRTAYRHCAAAGLLCFAATSLVLAL